MDIRAGAAGYYDLNPHTPDDVSFYETNIPSPDASVLELGCGTGRVLLPLVESCEYIQGIDSSEAMLAICRKKLLEEGIPSIKATVQRGDISNFELDRTFDLIIAPYRVFQNLETNAHVEGLFRCLRRHLSAAGTCILNVFKPGKDPDALRREWCIADETFAWETVGANGARITCHDRRPRMDRDNLVLYPELVYRYYEGDHLKDETVLKIAMRCYYPDGFQKIIVDHGFEILNRWGGYAGEPYGEGAELVVQFTDRV
jgi:SAM-dependent methyltransferase